MANEAVSVLTIKGNPVGLDQLAADVRAVEAAQKDVVASSAQVEKRALSTEAALRRLERQYDQTYRAQEDMARVTRTLDRALAQGLVTEERRSQLLALATERLNRASTANDNLSRSTGQASHQIQQLGFQVQDVAASLGSGASPFTVLLQQGGQVYSALSGPGGVSQGLRNVGDFLRSLVTPATVAGTALAAAATAAYVAWSRFDTQQKEVLRTLQGFGRGLQLTVDQFNQLAQRAASAGDISVARAQEIANALARTGNIDPTNIERITALAKDFAATFTSGDLDKVAAEMATRFGEGASGLNEMVKRLDLFKGKQRELYEDLIKQNRIQDAIAMVINGMNGNLARYEDTSSRIARAWENISKNVGDAVAQLGRLLDKLPSFESVTSGVESHIRSGGSAAGAVANLVTGRVLPTPAAAAAPPRASAASGPIIAENEAAIQAAEKATGMLTDAQQKLNGVSAETATRLKEQIDLYRRQSEQMVIGGKDFEDNTRIRTAMREIVESGTEAEAQAILKSKDWAEVLSVAEHKFRSMADAQGNRLTQADLAREAMDNERKSIEARTLADEKSVAVAQAVSQNRNRAIEQSQAAAAEREAGLNVERRWLQQMDLTNRGLDDQLDVIRLQKDTLTLTETQRAKMIAQLQAELELIQRLGPEWRTKYGPAVADAGQRYVELKAKVAEANADLAKTRPIFNELKDVGVNAFTSLAQAITSGVKPMEALHQAAKQVGSALLSGGINRIAQGDFVTGGVMAGVGAAINLFESNREQQKQKRQKQIEAFQRQQEEQVAALQKSQEEQIEAGRRAQEALNEAARAVAEAQEEAIRLAEEISAKAEAVARRIEGFQDRAFAAGLDTSTLEGRLAQFDRQAQREREEEARSGGEAIVYLEQALAAERLNIQRNYEDQAGKQLRDFYDQQARTIQKFIDDVQGGSQSTLAPDQRLAAAQDAFIRQVTAAYQGNQDALANITGYAASFREAGRDFYGSGAGYQRIERYILQTLQGLQAMAGGSPTPLRSASMGVAASPASSLLAANTNTPIMPLPSVPVASSGNDMAAELRSLRAEVVAFRKENGVNVMAGAQMVREGTDATTAAVTDTGNRQAQEIRMAAARPTVSAAA